MEEAEGGGQPVGKLFVGRAPSLDCTEGQEGDRMMAAMKLPTPQHHQSRRLPSLPSAYGFRLLCTAWRLPELSPYV